MALLPTTSSLPASSSSSGSHEECLRTTIVLTEECLRSTIERSMKQSGHGSVPRPDADTMTSAELLRYHAQTILDSNLYPPEKNRRLTGKTVIGKNWLLKQLVKDPTQVIAETPIEWACKRKLNGFVAHVTAAHFGLRVVAARKIIKELWLHISPEELQNWRLVELTFGLPNLTAEKGSNVLEDSIEMYGGLLTWHSHLAKLSEVISRMISADCHINEIAELAATDPELAREWRCFCTWSDCLGEQLGFEYRAMCMELCKSEASKAKVHFHVFYARDFHKWRTPEYGPIVVKRERVRYMNFDPYIRKANLRNANNPTKVLTQGLWYVLAPKIGSVFRYCKYALFKDLILLVLQCAAPMECLVHRRVPCVTLSCKLVGPQEFSLCVLIVCASSLFILSFVNLENKDMFHPSGRIWSVRQLAGVQRVGEPSARIAGANFAQFR